MFYAYILERVNHPGDQFYSVETLPVLGTGKLDLRKIREMASQFSNGAPGE